MKKLALFLLILGTLNSCGDDIPECIDCNFTCLDKNEENVMSNTCSGGECLFKIYPNTEVNLSEEEGLKAGNKNSFSFIFTKEDVPEIADDEITTILVFELAQEKESFSVENDQLKQLNLNFRTLCYCVHTDFVEISSGCMQGERQSDGKWFIQANLVFDYPDSNAEVKFEAFFD